MLLLKPSLTSLFVSTPLLHVTSLSLTRRHLVSDTAALSLSPSPCLCSAPLYLPSPKSPLCPSGRVSLPIDPGVVPDDPRHGFLLATRRTLLETKDGGRTWAPRSIPSAEDEDFN